MKIAEVTREQIAFSQELWDCTGYRESKELHFASGLLWQWLVMDELF